MDSPSEFKSSGVDPPMIQVQDIQPMLCAALSRILPS